MNVIPSVATPPRPATEPGTDTRELAPLAANALAPPEAREEDVPPIAPPPGKPWRYLLLLACVLTLLIAGVIEYRWRMERPFPVNVTRAMVRTVTETIAATGRVAGKREAPVGAQNPGVVRELRVREGDAVEQGQVIAQIENTVAAAQFAQAQEMLATARARQTETASGARKSETDAARARVRQAEAAVREAESGKRQAETAQAEAAAAVRQAQARRDLAARNRDRMENLYREGAVAAVEADRAMMEFTAADADLTAAEERMKSARAGIEGAQSGINAAREAARAVEAELRTLQSGPKPETVRVASRQVREAEEAVRVARAQVRSSVIRAPFRGTVTAILAEVGASVGPGSGIVRLVQTGAPEIRMDVDEGNLPGLRVGQRAVITSTAYRTERFEAKVARIGAQVDAARGTVEVVVAAPNAPDWMRPGQTLNVNIVTEEAARRLLIPTAALRSDGDHRFVLVVLNGRAVRQVVLPGEVTGDRVTILEGLKGDEQIIADPTLKFAAGAKVRVLPDRKEELRERYFGSDPAGDAATRKGAAR